MGNKGPEFYDQDAVFQTYMDHRRRKDNPNDTLEKPVFLELAGDLKGKRILDLGCGEAAFGRQALENGCRTYLGIEGSQKMAAAAQEMLSGTQGAVIQASLETWDYPQAEFDLVVSRLAMHYIEDINPVFARVYRALGQGGRFVFSVEHPVITSSDRAWQSEGVRQDWIVDGYFETGRRVTSWLGGEVVKYHRTVEDYFLALQQAGFFVESLRESRPVRAFFESQETFERRKRIPLFLFLAGRKR